MKNKFEKDFYESRDTWWSIQDQIENDADQNTVQELKHIMGLSLYNQRGHAYRDWQVKVGNNRVEKTST